MYKDLIDRALKARENAYVPYSKFKVGAAILTEDGTIVDGCNIENASYGATNCAERTAIFKAVSEGTRKIKAIAVAGDKENFTYPCGICRQVMLEFAENKEIPIIIIKNEKEYIIHTLEDIIPLSFTKDDLDRAKGEKNV